MFSVVCVCQYVCPQRGSHMAITHHALDLTVQGPMVPSTLWKWDLTGQGSPLLVTSGGQDWRSVQTFSLEDSLVLTSGGYWSTYGRQAGATHPTRMPSFLQRVLTLLEVDSSLEMECLSRLVPASCGEPSREEEECFSRMVGEPSREPCDHSRSPLTGESSRRTLATTSSFEPWCFSLTEPVDTRNTVYFISGKKT